MDNNNNCGKYDTGNNKNESGSPESPVLGSFFVDSPAYFVGFWGCVRFFLWAALISGFVYLIVCCILEVAPFPVSIAGGLVITRYKRSRDLLLSRKLIKWHYNFMPDSGAGLNVQGTWYVVRYVYGSQDVMLIKPRKAM